MITAKEEELVVRYSISHASWLVIKTDKDFILSSHRWVFAKNLLRGFVLHDDVREQRNLCYNIRIAFPLPGIYKYSTVQ